MAHRPYWKEFFERLSSRPKTVQLRLYFSYVHNMSRRPPRGSNALDAYAAYEEQLDRLESNEDGEFLDGDEASSYAGSSEMGDFDGLGTNNLRYTCSFSTFTSSYFCDLGALEASNGIPSSGLLTKYNLALFLRIFPSHGPLMRC